MSWSTVKPRERFPPAWDGSHNLGQHRCLVVRAGDSEGVVRPRDLVNHTLCVRRGDRRTQCRRRPECVSLALHHQCRHRHGEQLRQPCLRFRCCRPTPRRDEREGQRKHSHHRPLRRVCRCGSAGDSRPRRATSEHPRSRQIGPQAGQHRRPGDVERGRRASEAAASDDPRLIDADHADPVGWQPFRERHEVSRSRAGTGAVTEHHGQPRRAMCGEAEMDARRPERCVRRERRQDPMPTGRALVAVAPPAPARHCARC